MDYNIMTDGTLRRGLVAAFLTEATDFIFSMRWLILLALILIITDFWFGISASKLQKVPIRKSRAGRRTINKFIDYLGYILLGAGLGKAFGEPLGLDPLAIATVVMILCYGFEIDSIYSHICVLHGITKHISIWRILFLLITFKFKSLRGVLTDISEEVKVNKEERKQNKEEE